MPPKRSSVPPGLAVVTGASAGIGYELAVQFAQNGFDVVVAAEDDAIAAAASNSRPIDVVAGPASSSAGTWRACG